MGTKSDGGSDLMLAEERAKQARIAQGTASVNRIFGGGPSGTGQTYMYAPGMQYYTAQGQPWQKDLKSTGYQTWLSSQPGGVLTNNDRWDDYMKSLAGLGALYTGRKDNAGLESKKSWEGYDQPMTIYEKASKDYQDYATPQLQKQLGDMNSQLLYNMAERGLVSGLGPDGKPRGSTALNTASQDLDWYNTKASNDIANTASDTANKLRRDVSGEKSRIMSQLYASADPTSAVQASQSALTTYSAKPTFSPIGNMFTDWANMYLLNRYGQAAQKNPSQSVNYNFASTPVSGKVQ